MKCRARRIITRVIAFLLLSAIVNVAVAWGLSVALVKPMYYESGINIATNAQPRIPLVTTHSGLAG